MHGSYGSKLTDATWVADAARFEEDHAAAAEVFQDGTPLQVRVEEANAFLRASALDPVKADLNTDANIFAFLKGVESSLAAFYTVTIGQYAGEDWRDVFAGYATAAARRDTALGNRGTGEPPTSALFQTTDLIPNDAYLNASPAADAQQLDAEVQQTEEGVDPGLEE